MSLPFYFGEATRRLYGIYTPPTSHPLAKGVVLCYPWGQEYVRAHRSFRILADALAAKGLHVLRFDYFGTGDSAGEGYELDLEGCRGDVVAAVDELRSMSGVPRVALVGLRLGATLAAATAALEPRVRRLALWDPVVDGRTYVDELRRHAGGTSEWPGVPEAEVPAPDDDGEPPSVEVDGFPLTARFLTDLRQIRVADYAATASTGVLLAVTEETDLMDMLRATLEERFGTRFRYAYRSGPKAWQQELDFGAGAVPAGVIECLTSWGW